MSNKLVDTDMRQMQLSKYFSEREFLRSATASKRGIRNYWQNPEHRDAAIVLCKKMDEIREIMGPIIVTSGYRCPELNEIVGGVDNSYHVRGQAMDFRPAIGHLIYCFKLMEPNWAGGIALNEAANFIHVDTGRVRRWTY